jgi:hypothetical protein
MAANTSVRPSGETASAPEGVDIAPLGSRMLNRVVSGAAVLSRK